MSKFEAKFLELKDLLKPKQKKPKSEMKARHMHPIGLDPNSHPKHPGRFVPKMHQVKQENPKLTRMKSGGSKREILASWDVKQIIRQFNISPDINIPKKLGNTGIVMKFDPRYKKFILESTENYSNIPIITTPLSDEEWKLKPEGHYTLDGRFTGEDEDYEKLSTILAKLKELDDDIHIALYE